VALAFVPADAGLLGVQAALVAAPGAGLPGWLPVPRARAWALVPAGSVIAVVAGLGAAPGGARALTWLALVASPPLAAVALGWAMRGGRPRWAPLAAVALVLAWAGAGTLAGQAAGLMCTALGCVTLARLLAGVAPGAWLKVGIGLMAAVDAALVGADLLQRPNAVLNAAAPGPGLPRLQLAQLGTVQMGYGDLFIAALLGAVLAAEGAGQRGPALACLLCAAVFDTLFLVADELPATVPVAVVLLGVELCRRRRGPSARGVPGRRAQAAALGADQDW